MKCPFCGSEDTKVTDTRGFSSGNVIKRRRECEYCQKRFTTHEKVVDLSLYVIKKDGSKEPYLREKILKGINRAVEKRNVEYSQIENVIEQIERKILNEYSGEIKSSDLGDIIISFLMDLDDIAYIRFASVYKKFESLDSFIKEVEAIKNSKEKRREIE